MRSDGLKTCRQCGALLGRDAQCTCPPRAAPVRFGGGAVTAGSEAARLLRLDEQHVALLAELEEAGATVLGAEAGSFRARFKFAQTALRDALRPALDKARRGSVG